MPLTNAGVVWLGTAVMAYNTPNYFTAANAYIGVGDSSTAFAVTQTDLVAATNKVRVGMDNQYPQYSSTSTTSTLTFQATFGSGVANWAWAEWAVFNAASSGTMISRKVESNGTKSTGQSWVFQVQLTFGIGA